MPLIRDPSNANVRAVALSAANSHLNVSISHGLHDEFAAIVVQAFRADPHPAIHSIVELLLRRLDPELLEQETQRLIASGPKQGCLWFVDRSGQTMIVMDQEAAGIMDDPSTTFAIASAEVTHRQFLRLYPNHTPGIVAANPDDDVPASAVLLAEAMAYCNYLNDVEKIPKDQWCYDLAEVEAGNRKPPLGYRLRTGYRLPTDEEWEFACRAKSTTVCFFGTDSRLAGYYGWDRIHSGGLLRQSSILLPSPFGLFDIYGSVSEITVTPTAESYQMRIRGASFVATSEFLNSTYSGASNQSVRGDSIGFRVVRTALLNSN